MHDLLERGWFAVCTALGRMLRSARYARVHVAVQDGAPQVRKKRRLYAPLLVALGAPLTRVLDTHVQVLPQADWEQREQMLHRRLRAVSIHVESDGTLVLPPLPGITLASLLEQPTLDAAARLNAIRLAAVALAGLHHAGFTHGDAMAENVMIDLQTDSANWFDFETVHEAAMSPAWRRADDVRALIVTCVLRCAPTQRADTVVLILDAYANPDVIPILAGRFATAFQRALVLHQGQAALPFSAFRDLGHILKLMAAGHSPVFPTLHGEPQ